MKKNICINLLLLLILISCDNSYNDDSSIVIVNPELMTVDADAGSAIFNITTNGPWSISTSESWLKDIAPSQGDNSVKNQPINFTYTKNPSIERTGIISITCGSKTQPLKITQKESTETVIDYGSTYLLKAKLSIDSDGFNMLSDPSFEDYLSNDIKYSSPWDIFKAVETSDAYHGERAITINFSNSGWEDLCIQTIPLKKNVDYVETAWYKSSKNHKDKDIYLGVRQVEENTPVLRDAGQLISTEWTQGFLEFNSGNNTKAHAFTGVFVLDGVFPIQVITDNIRIEPKDVVQTSYVADKPEKVLDVLVELDNQITSSESCIAWDGGDGNIMIAFGRNYLSESLNERSNALAIFNNNVEENMRISFIKEKGIIKEIISPDNGEDACIPTTGVSIGSRQYIHYMSIKSKPPFQNTWDVNYSSLAYSEDNGQNWTKTDIRWKASGNFIESSFVKKDNYIYMFGVIAGRESEKICVARVVENEILNIDAWEYWNGAEWSIGDESKAVGITCGTSGEPTVIYNKLLNRYIMMYYSTKRKAIVYRDSRLPEGEWSGEKIFLKDDKNLKTIPSIFPLIKNDEIYVLVSSAKEE